MVVLLPLLLLLLAGVEADGDRGGDFGLVGGSG